MNINYIRIFLLTIMITIVIVLLLRWEESGKNYYTINKLIEVQNQEQTNNNILEDSYFYKNNSKNNIFLETNKFSSLEINPLNGTIINLSLKEYNISQNNNNPMAMLNNNSMAHSIIYINDQPQNIIFSLRDIKKEDNINILTLQSNIKGIDVIRKYYINDNTYVIKMTQSIYNRNDSPVTISFLNELICKHDTYNHKFNFLHSYSSFYGIGFSNDNNFKKKSFNDLKDHQYLNIQSNQQGWTGMIQPYFVNLLFNKSNNLLLNIHTLPNNYYSTSIQTQSAILKHDESIENVSILYSGPIITKNFDNIVNDDFLDIKPAYLNKLIDYGMLSFISYIIFWLMNMIHHVVQNWGLSIILVTFIIKMFFYPLSSKSYTSMEKIRLLQPRMKRLQEIYKSDRKQLSHKIMELYKKEKVNPTSGCLPMIIQIPVFIALYSVLLESVELRQASFIFWIHDLSSQDPYYILPILMGLSMLIQQQMNPTSLDSVQKKIIIFMPIIFTIFFSSFPSGLVLYWLTNNIISLFHQWYITSNMKN